MKACVAAAVLLLVHLGTARPPAEGGIVHDAPLGWRCIGHTSRRITHASTTTTERNPDGVTPTCLSLELAVRSTPPVGAGALVLVNPFHTGTSILAGIAGTLSHICR